MAYLPPEEYPLWKACLARGAVNEEVATTVGRHLAAIHNAFSMSGTAPHDFDTGTAFHALRIEPYLLATSRAHPDLAATLRTCRRTERTRLTVAW
jgi:hypothetical protein